MLDMFYKITIYILFLLMLSSCSSENYVNKKTEIKPNISSAVIEQQYACSSSDARSSALRRLWKLYGKKDIRTPYQVISENKVWVVKGARRKDPSKVIHVIIPKNSRKCKIKEIFHKRNIYYVQSRTPVLKKASDYKCSSHIVSIETCKKLIEFQNNR